VTTPDLIKTLSAEEKEKVLKNNYIDSYIYNYVKEIESKTL
jgi:hypothetical protein